MQVSLIAHLIQPHIHDSNTLFLLQIALGMQPDIPLHFLDIASYDGHLAVLEWYQQQSKLDLAWTSDAMDYASQNGHVAVLDWWKRSGLAMKWTYWAMDLASGNGHVAVLNWWKKSELGMKWSRKVVYWASQDHRDVLLWWQSYDPLFDINYRFT